MKKVIKCVAIVIAIILAVVAVGGAWLYTHPIFDQYVVRSEGIQYPQISYTPYVWFRVPPEESEQMKTFNDTIYNFAKEKEDKYKKTLNLTYDIDRHEEGGVTIILHGSGKNKDGKVEEFRESFNFDVTLDEFF